MERALEKLRIEHIRQRWKGFSKKSNTFDSAGKGYRKGMDQTLSTVLERALEKAWIEHFRQSWKGFLKRYGSNTCKSAGKSSRKSMDRTLSTELERVLEKVWIERLLSFVGFSVSNNTN
jgi:hypothetical protein